MAWREDAALGTLRVLRSLKVCGVPVFGSLGIGPGTVFFVDPTSGNNSNSGTSPDKAVADLPTAYGLCTSGAGDTIVVYSRGTTSAGTTSYLTEALTWSKHGITVIGVAAGTPFGRARIANDSTATDLAKLLSVTGSNNRFINLHFGNFGSDAAALGCVEVTGARNEFVGCHFIGSGHATPAAVATAYDFMLNGAQETVCRDCIFGTDTIIRAAANASIVFDGAVARAKFVDCEIMTYSETAGHGGVKFNDNAALSRNIVFKGCTFHNFGVNQVTALTAVFIGTEQASGITVLHNCAAAGWAAWSAASTYIRNCNGAAGNTAGGISVATT